MGERESTRPDGSTRRSLYWEMTREPWTQRRGEAGLGARVQPIVRISPSADT